MQTLTVKDVIKAELLRVCKNVTRKLREKEARKEKKKTFSREEVAEIEKIHKEQGLDTNQSARHFKIYSILHDAPELKAGSMLPLELFAVVLIESGVHHNYPANKPLIATSNDGYLWNPSDGSPSNWRFLSSDNPRYATDDEVEQCIKDLTDRQWMSFHTHAVFKPVTDAAMGREVMVEDAPASNGESEEGNGEIRLQDGRTITMSD